MKRSGHLFEQAVDFGALCAAARRAARGKAGTVSAAEFIFGLETEVLKLQRELVDGSYRPRPYRTFTISDPKPRTISAADFRDRVAHHALCAVLVPIFERAAIFDSYACRPGKGSHAAVRRARVFARRHDYFLKLDIRKFFEHLFSARASQAAPAAKPSNRPATSALKERPWTSPSSASSAFARAA